MVPAAATATGVKQRRRRGATRGAEGARANTKHMFVQEASRVHPRSSFEYGWSRRDQCCELGRVEGRLLRQRAGRDDHTSIETHAPERSGVRRVRFLEFGTERCRSMHRVDNLGLPARVDAPAMGASLNAVAANASPRLASGVDGFAGRRRGCGDLAHYSQ